MKTKISEREFTKQVIQFARLHGWKSLHIRAARTKDGWRTPVQGDGKGFPDLLLIRRGKIIIAELKVGKNKPTIEQDAWLQSFGYVDGVGVYLWRPEDWDEIERILGGSDGR